MNRTEPDTSSAERIQAALDELVARQRRDRAAAPLPSTPTPSVAGLPVERRPWGRWVLVAALAATMHAAGIYWYVQSKSEGPALVLEIERAPSFAGGEPAGPVPRPTEPAAAYTAEPMATAPGIIEHNGRTIIVPPSAPGSASPPRSGRVSVEEFLRLRSQPAPAHRPALASTASAAPAIAIEDHAKAAKNFAYQHFRYKYKVGSANYAVTSLNPVITDTEEVVGWNRYRSTGEAGLEYYDNSGFRRTTRRFEVLTEEKNGEARALEITVK